MFKRSLLWGALVLATGPAVWYLVSNAWALVTANSFITPQTPNLGVQTFIQGTDGAGVPKTLYTGAANGSKCTAIMENNSDQTQTHLLTFHVIHSAVTATIATLTTTLSSGAATFGTTVDVMSTTNWPGLPRDGSGNPYLFLANGDTLKAQFASNLTATDAIHLLAVCSDF